MPNSDQTQNPSSRHFIPEELEKFKAIGIANPDPAKQYTIDELENARNREQDRIRGVFQNDQARRDSELNRARDACSFLVNKYTNGKQAQANQDSGKDKMAESTTQARAMYDQARKDHYARKAPYIGMSNAGHSSYVLYMLFDLILISGSRLFKDFNGADYLPQTSIDKIPVTPEEELKAREELQKSLDRMGIRPVRGDPNNPDKITALDGPDFSACTPEQQQARRDELRKVQQELGFSGSPQHAPSRPTI